MTKQRLPDRRVRRTKQRLNDALESLIIEKGYDKITVQDLIDRADVGRSTFYAHYETKDDLLVSWTQLAEDMDLHMAQEQTDAESIIPSLALFRHLGEYHRLYRAMIGGGGIDIVTEMIHSRLLHHATFELERRAKANRHTSIPIEVRAGFLASSLLALLTWWLDNDMPYPPESMDEMYQELTRTT
ncbi:MAG: TetR/AcrR family transcriptional regulator [Acidobacteria bacterium]|nr:TetR/AcrR family transcriptional regulator [Acidobacteriota bacterium]